jgi:hypothetical protein
MIFPDEISLETFEIKDILFWSEVQDESLGWGKYSKKTLKELVEDEKLPEDLREEPFIYVKSLGKVIKNPNLLIPLPARFFYRHLSQPIIKNKEHLRIFQKYTLLPPIKRYQLISGFLEMLEVKQLAGKKTISESQSIEIARPGIQDKITQEYGRIPDFQQWGFESWGDLKRINIYFMDKGKLQWKAKEFMNILKEQIENISKHSSFKEINIEISLNPVHGRGFNFNKIINELDKKSCPIFIMKDKFGNYKNVKTKLTQENGIPTQVIREQTIFRSRNLYALARTLLPQIIAKSGGLPYKLAPPILDRALLIGLDKARDSSGRNPSASAGIAAVTPEGHYVSGASTPLEKNSTDFIDVDTLAPTLLKELEEKNFNDSYDYIVILRDGSPQTCIHEVPKWKQYLQDYQKELVFLASRKTHPFRLFPINISEAKSPRKSIKYDIPLILDGKPLSNNDFLVLASRSPRGTPKPILYTIMENTVGFSTKKIKEKIIPQIISMSMLCWESPLPTSQPLPLHYADKLAEFTQLVQQSWNSSNRFPMFI